MTAVIYRGPTRGYTLTNDDVLWLARGFAAEGPHTRKHAQWLFWTWIGRYMLMPEAAWGCENWSTFSKLVKYHAQSLSPLWDDPADPKCSQRPDMCSPAAIARRAKNRSRTQHDLEKLGVWQFATGAQEGRLKTPTSEPLYDFIQCKENSKYGINIDGNCFYTYSDMKAKGAAGKIKLDKYGVPYRVQTDPSSTSILKWTISSAAAVMLGYGAWSLWDGRRRK